jgi:hypothetical protein
MRSFHVTRVSTEISMLWCVVCRFFRHHAFCIECVAYSKEFICSVNFSIFAQFWYEFETSRAWKVRMQVCERSLRNPLEFMRSCAIELASRVERGVSFDR